MRCKKVTGDECMSYFEKVTPESVGIDSLDILAFLDDVEEKGIEQHSIMILRHGKCCASGFWTPYDEDTMHPLYSFSKTLTATAIGFAEQEGILSVNEKLVDIFPDDLPEKVSENLSRATLHHLLTMSCGHETEISWEMDDNWIRSFLAHPFKYEPGTFYLYNTVGTNMLAAALKRKTGQDVTEFLKPRLFKPLGIERIYCAKGNDSEHIEFGGAGMKLTTEDMAKFTQFLLNRGSWEGKQLLRENWFDKATIKQIETEGDSAGHVSDWAYGYGYQCWMGSLPGSFRADGAYGQFGFVYPSLDLAIIMTTATEQTQTLLDSMNQLLIPKIHENTVPEEETSVLLLEAHLEDACLPVFNGDRCPAFEQTLNGEWYEAMPDQGDCCSLDILIGGAGLWDLKDGRIDAMSFTMLENEISWKIREGDEVSEIIIPVDQHMFIHETHGHTYAAIGRWRSYGVLEMEVRRTDAISGARIIVRFQGDTITLDADETLISAGGLGMHPKHTVPFVKA